MFIRDKRKIFPFIFIFLGLLILLFPSVATANNTTWIELSSGSKKDLLGIWGTGSSNVYAVGKSGTILQYDGSTWNQSSSGITDDLYGVWGDGKEVITVGKSGIILKFDGSDWNSINSGTVSDLKSIWGASRSDIFAVGRAGTILNFDGSKWSPISTGITSDLYCVWGVDSRDVFAVGSSGTLLFYDGSGWSSQSISTLVDLHSIWGTNSNDVFAAGNSGTILHFDGSEWSSMNSGTTGDLYGIWGANSTDVFAVGESGTIVHYDGSKWNSMNRNTLNNLRAVWGSSSSDVFIAGGSGVLLRYMPPVINTINPGQGYQGATLEVMITGLNLNGVSEVNFGPGIAVNSFTEINSNQLTSNITIVTGAGIGVRNVSVTTRGGSFTLPNVFTVNRFLPIITSISPDMDRQGATLNVTITGSNLVGASELRLGTGISVNSFTALSSNQITANISLAADAPTGTKDVSVTTPGGSFTLPGSFTLKQALPTLTSISPDRGNQETTFDITISGTNLTGASEIRLGAGITVHSFTVLSPNQIAANVTLAANAQTGSKDISVITPGGSFTLPDGFTVKQALPTLSSISPAEVNQGATLNITLLGTNLTGTGEVRVGTGIAVNSFTVLSSNQIEANITILAGAAIGATDVTVSTPGGSFTLQNFFAVKPGQPSITTISPNQGSPGTGLEVIISGSHLEGATSVSFGTGVVIKSFTILSPTQLSANLTIVEDAVTGMRDVSVTTPGGSSTLGSSFNVKSRSLGTIIIALIWVGVVILVVLFALILSILRRNRVAKL
jgi:hypothetical protein